MILNVLKPVFSWFYLLHAHILFCPFIFLHLHGRLMMQFHICYLDFCHCVFYQLGTLLSWIRLFLTRNIRAASQSICAIYPRLILAY